MSMTPPTGWRDDSRMGPLYAGGMVMFGAFILGMVGVFQFLEGISALRTDTIYVKANNYTFSMDVTAWGWIHMIVGAIAVVVSIGLFLDWPWAKWAGIVVSVLGAATHFAFIPYYPVWSIVVIAFYGLVIWALCYQLRQH